MPRDRSQEDDYFAPLKRLVLAVVLILLAGIFLIWRIDSPRVERLRTQVVDHVMPDMNWAMVPVTYTIDLLRDIQSYKRLQDQNQELRRELQQMKAWKEAALQLEQENARLLDLNKVQLDPQLTYVTGVVMADSGSPYRQSVLLNVGKRDGILDGWAAMDGLGLVGRITGVGDQTSRVLLLTDTSSRLPVTIQPSGQTAIVQGDNTMAPVIDFIEDPDQVRPGDRVVTSGDGGVFPPDLLVGQVAQDSKGRLRVRLAADYERLEYLRVLRDMGYEKLSQPGNIVIPGLNGQPQVVIPGPHLELPDGDGLGDDPATNQDGENTPPEGTQATGGQNG